MLAHILNTESTVIKPIKEFPMGQSMLKDRASDLKRVQNEDDDYWLDDVVLHNGVNMYSSDVRQVELLPPEQVKHLARIIQQGRHRVGKEYVETEEARAAREQLIEANLRLVLYVARKYRGFGVELMDLVQEGNLGLMHAVEKYDPAKGYMFSTYAIWWIRQYIARALASQGRVIRLPQYKVEEINRMRRVRRRLEQLLQNEPTLDELAEQMQTNVEEVVALLSASPEVISLDTPGRGGENEPPLSEVLEDDPNYLPERVVLKETLQEHVQELLSQLTARERRVLELRYGLNTHEHSLQEISRKMGLSHEAVRQVELRALRKLSHPSRDRMLQDFLR